ncbi:MAG TPA: hypothetical protein VH186_36975 [Chloroflexia bacterium]|nr:hypothetical protein [Chloroflexia bacterium]
MSQHFLEQLGQDLHSDEQESHLRYTRNVQRRIQARREEILPAIEKTAQHLFAKVEAINFEQGMVELILPPRGDRMSIRVSQIGPKTCLINVLTGSNNFDVLQSRSRRNIREFFRTLRHFLPKTRIF